MNADEILSDMAETFKERRSVYGNNYKLVGEMMAAAHPQGKLLHGAEDFELWHLWELVFVKLSRFANSGLEHKDSIHDAAIYCAMIESILNEREKSE